MLADGGSYLDDLRPWLDSLSDVPENDHVMALTGLDITHFHDFITKTCLFNFDPLKPHFYIVRLGLTGVYTIFSYFSK